MGSGGAFGLLSTLVGESLPGSGPYVAVGNALNQGPVLYHFPQSLITAVRERAAAGDMHLRQLELDLFRCATFSSTWSASVPTSKTVWAFPPKLFKPASA